MAGVMTWRDILVTAIGERGPDALTDLAVRALEREMTLIGGDEDLLALARSSSAANLALVAELTRGSVRIDEAAPPPQAAAFARELARRNVPMAELARAYRIVQRAMWRFGVDEIRARADDAAAAATAIEEYTDATFATGEVLMGSALERYALERDRWVRSADAVRRATVEQLLAGGAVDIVAASGRLRYELRREHVAFVVWADADDAVLESAATAVGGAGALVVPLGAGVVAGWCSPGALALDPAAASARVGVGEPGPGLEGFRRSHAEALEARRVARLGGLQGTIRYREIALAALLTSDLAQAQAFAQRELAGLAGDEPSTRRLAGTVLAVLEAQGSPRHAAQRLGLHENTVAKRVRAAEELLGRSIDQRPAELLAALIVQRAAHG
jgi:hypothetical protein